MSIQPTAANERTVRALVDLLKSTSVGQRITYHQLKQAVGFDIRTNRFLLFRAMRIAADESGAIFSNVRQVGYERLPAKEAATLGQQRRRRVRRGLKLTTNFMVASTSKANDLSRDEQLANWREITHCGLLIHQSYDRSAPPIPDSALPSLPPDPGKTGAESLDSMREALGRTA